MIFLWIFWKVIFPLFYFLVCSRGANRYRLPIPADREGLAGCPAWLRGDWADAGRCRHTGRVGRWGLWRFWFGPNCRATGHIPWSITCHHQLSRHSNSHLSPDHCTTFRACICYHYSCTWATTGYYACHIFVSYCVSGLPVALDNLDFYCTRIIIIIIV